MQSLTFIVIKLMLSHINIAFRFILMHLFKNKKRQVWIESIYFKSKIIRKYRSRFQIHRFILKSMLTWMP